MKSWMRATALCAVLTLVACGDDNNEAKNNANNANNVNNVGDVVTQLVTAAGGGTVSVGGATFTIPTGALAEDTEITLEVLDASSVDGPPSGIRSSVIEAGPEGLEFLSPITVELSFSGTPAEGETPIIVWSDGSGWTTLIDSSVSGSRVTATTDHFTAFTVTFVTGSTDSCSADTFAGCGGDLVGTWGVQNGCVKLDANPFGDSCPEFMSSTSVTLSGNITFNSDNTYSDAIEADLSLYSEFPESCLDGGTCQDAEAVKNGDLCVIEQMVDDTADEVAGTWTVTGTEVCLLANGDDQADCFEFCVSGNTATFASYDSSEQTNFMYDIVKQ